MLEFFVSDFSSEIRTAMSTISDAGKYLLTATLLCNSGHITNHGKAFLKELILDEDAATAKCLSKMDAREGTVDDSAFLDEVRGLVARKGEEVYDDLFRRCSLEDGKHISKSERQEKDLKGDKNLIYGEVDYGSFLKVMLKLKLEPGGTFYDLGSGTGRALFAARLNLDFDKCIGVEILEGLYGASVEITDRYNRSVRGLLSAEGGTEVETHLGSLLEFDWSDATVCFANSTCFGDRLMEELSEQAARLRPGAYFVTFTKPLAGKAFKVIEKKRYSMSWGPATVFIQQRVPHSVMPPPHVASSSD